MGLAGFVALCLAIGAIGGAVSAVSRSLMFASGFVKRQYLPYTSL